MSKVPPAALPTLTEVVELVPEPPALGVEPSARPESEAMVLDAESRLVQNVMREIEHRLGEQFDARLNALIVSAVEQVAEPIANQLRMEMSSAVRDALLRALAAERNNRR